MMDALISSGGISASPRLLDQVRGKIRLKQHSLRTEQAYLDWIKRFIRHHGKRHPREMGAVEVEAFLTHLAVAGRVAASTQNQAKSALLFLYREVLEVELPWLDNVQQAKAPRRLPVVLTRDEVHALLGRMHGTHWLVASLLYGTGMRIMECLRLRVKDVDFARGEILIRDGKGFKDRVTMLPGWQSRRRRIRCAIRSPRTCSNLVTTYEPFRSCSGIRMCPRP
jgi:site-specific recombinase XerD